MGGQGYAAAVISAALNGSFAAFFKLESVARVQLDPLLFQLYVSLGVFLSSLICFAFLGQNPALTGSADAGTTAIFTPLGLAAGALFVLSITFSFAAVDLIGIALAQGVWGGIAILVSFVWGVAAFGNHIEHPALAACALMLLLLGVVGIALCEQLGVKLARICGAEESCDASLRLPLVRTPSDGTSERPIVPGDDNHASTGSGVGDKESAGSRQRTVLGMCAAALVGLFGGSILVPMHYVPESATGLAFVPSFGVGVLLASPLALGAGIWLRAQACGAPVRDVMPRLYLRETLPAGLASGLVWNASNVCSIAAIPSLGYSVAYPILQCALLFSAVWGVVAFREIRGVPAITTLFVSGSVLLSGAACLAVSTSS
eukprot:g5414.t1